MQKKKGMGGGGVVKKNRTAGRGHLTTKSRGRGGGGSVSLESVDKKEHAGHGEETKIQQTKITMETTPSLMGKIRNPEKRERRKNMNKSRVNVQ